MVSLALTQSRLSTQDTDEIFQLKGLILLYLEFFENNYENMTNNLKKGDILLLCVCIMMLSRRADVTALIWTQTSFIPCNAVTPLACA